MQRRSSHTARFPPVAASGSSRTPVGSGSSAPTPARPRGSSSPRSPRRHARCSPGASPSKPVSATRSTFSARPPPRPTGPRSTHSSPTRTSTRSSRSSFPRSSPAPTTSRQRSAESVERLRLRQDGHRRDRQRRRHATGPARSRLPGDRAPLPRIGRASARVAADHAEWLRRPAGQLVEPVGIDSARARGDSRARRSRAHRTAGSGPTPLERCSRPTVSRLSKERLAGTADEAVDAAATIGFPVVVKLAEPGLHKTDVGGVALDLRDDLQVRDAVERDGRRGHRPAVSHGPYRAARRHRPGSALRTTRGLRTGWGIRRADRRRRLQARASHRPRRRRARDGTARQAGSSAAFEARRQRIRDALRDLVVRLGRLADDLPEVSELDLNPVLADPDGCVAVDARVRVREATAPDRLKSW